MFDKVTFEISGSEEETLHKERILPVIQAYDNYYKLEEIGSYLRRYDKHLDLTDAEQILLDKIREKVFDIIGILYE